MATDSAYGSWVRTWSTWSAAEAMEERIVVSEMGEQWSPKTAPESTAPMVAIRMRWLSSVDRPASSGKWYAMGMTMGVRIAIVAQEVPVENAMNAATTKVSAGMRCGDSRPRVR